MKIQERVEKIIDFVVFNNESMFLMLTGFILNENIIERKKLFR